MPWTFKTRGLAVLVANTDRAAAYIRFGSCELDLESRRLYRAGRDVHLTTKAFDLLKILVEHAPKALTKAELHDLLWPNTFVSDDALARLISNLRVTIGDNPREPKVIRTIHGFGYSLEAKVRDGGQPPYARCKLTWARHEFPLGDGENVIGRDPDVAVPINASIVSRRHARIMVTGAAAQIEDLGSKNGTCVGEERVSAPRTLSDGDVIKVGDHELTFRLAIPDTPTATSHT